MIMDEFFWWSGVITWLVLGLLGLYAAIDQLAEWLIDSASFKRYVWSYLKDRAAKRG